jgi:imidazole glycerol-phosphate synthase subunit HisF
MHKKVRIVPRLDVKGENVVKGIHLEGLRVVGKPAELARRYYEDGADELLYVDIVASLYGRNNLTHIIEEAVSEGVFIPITVAGGIRSIDDITRILRSGADKVAINSAAVRNPQLLMDAVKIFGSSTIVLSVEAKRQSSGYWEVYTDNGREKSGLDVLKWIMQAQDIGVGEILLTSVDREGTREGFDMDLVRAVNDIARIPVVVSGGAGKVGDFCDCMEFPGIDGIAVADLLHYNRSTVKQIKSVIAEQYPERVRLTAGGAESAKVSRETTVSIVDYGVGNLRSICNTFSQLGARVEVVNSPERVRDAECVVLPGVGAFELGIKNLRAQRLIEPLKERAALDKKTLGICLGMQLMMSRSYEFGDHEGLGIFEGDVCRFEDDSDLVQHGYKIPHVGWNDLLPTRNFEGTCYRAIRPHVSGYFVHSYYVRPVDQSDVLAKTRYFGREFCAMIGRGRVVGCQYHPEKSGISGKQFLCDFLAQA